MHTITTVGLDAVERDGGDAFQTWIRRHDEYP
jgi:hypothetical protein